MTTFYTVSGNADCPDIRVEIDVTNQPTNASRVWTNITPYVRQLSYQRGGRSHELRRTDAGTLTMLLDNRDGRFDPTNTASPYYPNLKRMRWLRVTGKWAGVEYARWAGLVEGWAQEWPELGRDAVTTVQAADAFKILALYDLGGKSYASALTGTRVGSVLTDVAVPYTAGAGKTTVVASGTIATGTKALSHLQDVVDSENGLLFADPSGQIVFQDRHFRLTDSNSITSVCVIGDGPGEIPYREGRLDSDDVDVWPTVKVTPDGGTVETQSDATSQAEHFDRVLEKSILSSSQAEALSAAQWLSGQYADPAPRLPQVGLVARQASTRWPTVLGLTNSQRVTWKRRASTTITVDAFVEQVLETIVPGTSWDTAVQLSPADDAAYWLLGVAGFSELGTTTILAY